MTVDKVNVDSAATPRTKAPVSVLMPVKNEEQNLRRSLPALTWAD